MDGEVTPDALLALSDETLRAVGLSAAKVRSLRDLATKVLEGTVVVAPRRLGRQSDEKITRRLTTVRGIGPWSADMFLMFQLRRLDVWPVVDLGVRQGYALIWSLPTAPEPTHLEELGEGFRPYRSIVARYCWAALAEQRTLPLPTPDTTRPGKSAPERSTIA